LTLTSSEAHGSFAKINQYLRCIKIHRITTNCGARRIMHHQPKTQVSNICCPVREALHLGHLNPCMSLCHPSLHPGYVPKSCLTSEHAVVIQRIFAVPPLQDKFYQSTKIDFLILVQPVPRKLSYNGAHPELKKCQINGTRVWPPDGSASYCWHEEVPTMKKPPSKSMQWRFQLDWHAHT